MENFVIISLPDTVKRKNTFLQLIKKIHGSGPDKTDKLNHTTTLPCRFMKQTVISRLLKLLILDTGMSYVTAAEL